MRTTIWKKVTILVLILAVPGFLYYLLTAKGKNRYKPLAFFGPKEVEKTSHKFHGKVIPDTNYYRLPPFKLTDQDGKPFTQANLEGKIFVAGFFYTHCPTVCNTINKNVSYLVGTYWKNKMVYFLSITVDPERDTPDVLKNYLQSFKPESNRWMFLSGDTSSVYNLARRGFLVDAVQTGKNDFIYSDKLILVDQDKHIRGYYSGANTTEVNRLNDEIKVLIAEELRKRDKPLY
ncbi:MAG TPA: SCO family protein [Mucilaginibacter sp.]